MSLILETICIPEPSGTKIPRLYELLPLLINKVPDIVRDVPLEEDALEKVRAIMRPYEDGGRFSIEFLEPKTLMPISYEHAPSAVLYIEYTRTVH